MAIEDFRNPFQDFKTDLISANQRKLLANSLIRLFQNNVEKSIRNFAKEYSGRLAASWDGQATFGPHSITVKFWSKEPYARIQEKGGTIRPVNAKALTIPLVPRAKGVRARAFPEPLHIAGRTLQNASGQAIYALAKQVTIPATRYLTKARQATMKEFRPLLVGTIRGNR